MTHVLRGLAALLLASVALPAVAAANDLAAPVAFEVELGVVSDYRFRGLSLSDHDPAIQGGLTASLASGAYGYVWGSTIDAYGAGSDGSGAKVETDLVVGWAGALGGLDIDASAQAYVYPGGSGVDYVEFPATISQAAGDWRWTLGAAYAPSQDALGHDDNIYGWGGLSWSPAGSKFKGEVRAGYEDGAYAPGGKWDWSVGLTRDLGPVAAGLAYVDSDRGSASAVVSLVATF